MKLITSIVQMGFAVTCILLATAPAIFGQNPAKGYRVAPGVLIDPDNTSAYLMTPKREVVAVSLEDGEIRWSSKGASKPIAIRGNRLIAQAEKPEADSMLQIVSIDTANGEIVGSRSIDLGAGVVVSVDDGKDHQFLVGTENYDTLIGPVVWRYFRQEFPGPDEVLPEPFERFGAFDVTEVADSTVIASGGSAKQSGKPPYAQPRVMRPRSEKPAVDKIILDLGSGQRFRLDGAAVANDQDEPAAAVKTPSSGLYLSEGDQTWRIPGEQFCESADGGYIASSTFAGKLDDQEPYRWVVYKRDGFEAVAQFMAKTSLAPFIVAEGRVLYLRQAFQWREGGKLRDYPLALVARDVKSGRIVWTQAVRDTRYRGPTGD